MAKNKDENNEGKSGKKIILIVISIILLLGVGLGAGFLWANRNGAAATAEPKIVEAFYPLGGFSVNLADRSPMRYIKVTISLGYDSESDLGEKLPTIQDKLKDLVNDILLSKKAEELDANGIKELKTQILNEINNTLEENKLIDVYFTEILIQ